MFDSISRPGSRPSISTRQGDDTGVLPTTASVGRSWRRELGDQGIRRVPPLQVHPGKVVDVRLGDRRPGDSRQLEQQRQADQPFGLESAHRPLLVIVLVGRREVAEDQRIRRRLLGQAELGALADDREVLERILLGDDIAEGHAVVVGPRLDCQPPRGLADLGELDPQGVVAIADRARLARGNGVRLVRSGATHPDLPESRPERRLAVELQADGRVDDDRLASIMDPIAQSRRPGVRVAREPELDLAVRGRPHVPRSAPRGPPPSRVRRPALRKIRIRQDVDRSDMAKPPDRRGPDHRRMARSDRP